jgi:hypothetical protein
MFSKLSLLIFKINKQIKCGHTSKLTARETGVLRKKKKTDISTYRSLEVRYIKVILYLLSFCFVLLYFVLLCFVLFWFGFGWDWV